MKIAIFGPDRRVGVVQENRVIDINAAYAKYLAETTPTARPLAEAAAAVPPTQRVHRGGRPSP